MESEILNKNIMVLIFAESSKGRFKKAALEAVTYGKKIASALGTDCAALTLGNVEDAGQLGEYGASNVYNVAGISAFDSQVYSSVIADAAKQLGATVVIVSSTSTGKALAGRLSVRLGAGMVSGANGIPSTDGGFTVKKSVFSGKAIAHYTIKSAVKVISLMGNALPPEKVGSAVAVTPLSINVPASRVTVKEVKTAEGIVPLPEAELVVSAGRGMKGPENWVEDLAGALNATTACSRPVADAHWRPHHEHVGQTGVAIRPNLYIAIGISGAIQHLAGVNNSKVIVVINKDPEAPFFKAADYGVVGDAFEILPRLTEAVKKYKAS
jgi:electron transfer flavoprotein alpha subunit